MEKETTHRVVFARQPARIFMVDLNHPFDMDMCHCLNQALDCFMNLVSRLVGPSRVPFFGLCALTDKCQVLFPLQCTKGNVNSLRMALGELQAICNSYHGGRLTGNKDFKTDIYLRDALQTATAQYKQQSQSLIQSSGYWCQLEVFLVTCQDGMKIARQIENAIHTENLDDLKKVQIILLSNPEHFGFNLQLSGLSNSQSSDCSITTSSVDSIVDVTRVNADPLSFDQFFKSWMRDGGTEKEHLHIIMPPAAPGGPDLVIKCDIHERLVNPALLPHPTSYSLHIDAGLCRPGLGLGNKQGGFTVPVHRLRAVNQVQGDQMCESVLFGLPLILKPTSCWKLDWDDLDSNQQHFQAISQLLLEKVCELGETECQLVGTIVRK
ncbi:meiosis 1 arrest protein-like [Tubulanus polymorphus]|uniref:meiosis 1 arrest protein-like n=1 Tax=Tubulanus polymorphus TaxID=672921 RepID=UPI003DA621DC